MTPLEILALVLGEKYGKNPPVGSTHKVQEYLLDTAISPREQEVSHYLIAASRGELGHQGSRGSLKHTLWWLREYGGELYIPLARKVIEFVLQREDIPLQRVTRYLSDLPPLAPFADVIGAGVNGHALAMSYLQDRRQVGRWTVVINHTPLNLLSVAMRHTEADIYIAVSPRGGVIKVRRGVPFPLDKLVTQLGEEWIQPYPDLAVRRPNGWDREQELKRLLEKLE